jgi:hypothetical protein
VNRSIRLRIALAVFTVVVSLVALQIVYVLSRFQHSFVDEIDDRLEEDLGELRVVLGSDRLPAWIEQTTGKHRREDEIFIEIRDAADRIVARSRNVPETGFPGAPNLAMGGGRATGTSYTRAAGAARGKCARSRRGSGRGTCGSA